MDNEEMRNKVLVFANSNPVSHLATLDGDQPRVRGMLLWFADETGYYYHTGSTKKLASQLINGAKAEIAFFRPTQEPGKSEALRATGKIEILNDKELEKRLFQERPWILENRKAVPDAEVIIFRICKGESYIWDMTMNLREHTAIRVAI